MSNSRWRQQYKRFTRYTRGITTSLTDLNFTTFLRWKANRASGKQSQNCPATRAINKRRARHTRHKILKILDSNYRWNKRRTLPNIDLLSFKMKSDSFRDALAPDFSKKWVEIPQRLKEKKAYIIDLSRFSFAKDPDHTIALLREAAMAAARYPDVRLNFIDDTCDDLASYILLARLRETLPPVFLGGFITNEIRKVVDAVGLRRPLRMNAIKYKKHVKNNVSAFPLLRRLAPDQFGDISHQLRPQHKEKVAEQFVDTINSWLRDNEEQSLELTPHAEDLLITTIGEILDNAERHSNPHSHSETGDWWIAGFRRLSNGPSQQTILDCSVAIVSIGTTISESLETAAPDISEKINQYVREHAKRNKPGPDRELLRTVMALQDGITRKQAISENRLGGTGFMHLITTFAAIGANAIPGKEPLITILSGKSCIRVTPPYIKPTTDSNTGLKELWLNDGNDRSQPPDPAHAFAVQHHFPGTIVSMRFSIDASHLSKSIQNEPASDDN